MLIFEFQDYSNLAAFFLFYFTIFQQTTSHNSIVIRTLIYFYYCPMQNPQNNQFSIVPQSHYGKKLLRTHEGLKNILKKIEIGQRKGHYTKRQPRPPCYHPGAAKKEQPIRKSASFLSTSREGLSILNIKTKSQFKYQPIYNQVCRGTPSWTIPKHESKDVCQLSHFMVCSKNPILHGQNNNQEEEINQQQRSQVVSTNNSKQQSFMRRRQNLKTNNNSTAYNTSIKNNSGFHIINSLQLTKSEMRHQQRLKTQCSNRYRGYVNMSTQSSRPQFLKKIHTNSDTFQEPNSPKISQSFQKIHDFASYTPRKTFQSKALPEYYDINYNATRPRLKGYIKFSSFKSRPLFGEFRQTGSFSLLDYTPRSSSFIANSKNFDRMLGRKGCLFPKTEPNIKKKGDSSILKILRQASKNVKS